MHVVTFYSYKGGVGRSMALVNVALLLAQSGRRVLVVDFDLEAPGLTSYAPFACAAGLPGIVDYVETYRRELVAPRAADFISQCETDGHPIWVMPAGASSAPGYTERLNAIDWEELYSAESGYLMFEDMRQQWAGFEDQGFDYVLLDSRTGHTDVGGICTRQLPDTVVVLFVPNSQNIDGLVPIVDGIRSESGRGTRQIQLHFCPSNLPDEYDEEGILERVLGSASKRLRYSMSGGLTPTATLIHHRTSLELLEDPLLVQKRPRAKLAKEYEQLRIAIVARNMSDRDGALELLRRVPEYFERERNSGDGRAVKEIEGKVAEIARCHPGDGEIAMGVAEAFRLVGEYAQEVAFLSIAIDAGYHPARARLLRSIAMISLNRQDDALDDIKAVLVSSDGTSFEFQPAVQLLRVIAKNPGEVARALFSVPSTKPRAKVAMVPLLGRDVADLNLVADTMLADMQRADLDPEVREIVANQASLALIGAGRYGELLDRMAPASHVFHMAQTFNRAIAQWALTGSAPLDAFKEVAAAIPPREQDANWHQCFALVRAVLGERDEALRELDRAQRRVTPTTPIFSCWTYRWGTGTELLHDLREMRRAIQKRREDVRPPFIPSVH